MNSGGNDKYAGMTLMGAGILVGTGTMTLQTTSIARYGARMMPFVVASALFALGFCIFIQGRRAENAAGRPKNDKKHSSLPVFLTFALLAFYVAAIEVVGFPVATFVYVVAQTHILSNFNRKKLPRALWVAFIGTAAIFSVFTNYFHVLFPSGLF